MTSVTKHKPTGTLKRPCQNEPACKLVATWEIIYKRSWTTTSLNRRYCRLHIKDGVKHLQDDDTETVKIENVREIQQ